MQRTTRLTLALALLPVAAASVTAHAGCNSDASSCLWYVPTYDQHDPGLASKWFIDGGGTNLCAPTAAAMALKAILDLNGIKSTTGWTSTSFASATKLQRIENMASLMGTIPEKGTYSDNTYASYKARKPGILTGFPGIGLKLPLMSAYEKYGAAIDLEAFRTFVQRPTALIANYGHYNKVAVKLVSLPTLKYSERTYERDGGHAITPRGVLGSVLFYNDPSGGTIEATTLKQVLPRNDVSMSGSTKLQVVETLPGGAARLAYLDGPQSGNYYPLLEGMMALRY